MLLAISPCQPENLLRKRLICNMQTSPTNRTISGKKEATGLECAIMVVLIYGAGAVGLGLASCLLKDGAKVDLIAREDTVLSLQQHGLDRTGIFGTHHVDPHEFRRYTSLTDVQAKYDYVIVCVKSFDSRNAAEDLSSHPALFGNTTRIVLSQNGWGNAETFTSFFDKERIYNARVITGFERPNSHTVTVTVHADAIHIGSLFGISASCVRPLCESIAHGDIPCETTEEIGKDLWAKMLYNCALNPLGAVLDCPYGALAKSQTTRAIMDHIVDEVFTVMTTAGFETHFSTPEAFLDVFYRRLVPDTTEHRSSTLQDIEAGRKTEIEALNGAVIQLAQKHNLDVPYNRTVYNLVKFLEGKNL